MKENRLHQKVAIVTGAGQGMGAAIARIFADNGAKVVLNDISEERAKTAADKINTDSNSVIHYAGDISNEDDVRRMIQLAMDKFGAVHIMANNAGILYPTRFEDITTAEYDKVIDVSMKGTFLCSREVVPIMKKQKWGRIINMSSSAGRSVSTLGGVHYTAAKAGMLGLTRAVAREVAPFGITVNAVCPGLIDTEMVHNDIPPARLQQYIDSFPIPRLGTPFEVAQLFLFLASDESAYITGASIDINGGDLML